METVRVLEADPGLGQSLSRPDPDRLRARATARVERVAPGPWQEWRPARPDGHLGLLVLDGLLLREVSLLGRSASELLGPGDVLRPWEDERATGPVPVEASWSVVEPARLAVLDQRFAERTASLPELTAAIASRVMGRARWAALLLAVNQLRPVELRLMVLLWHLADRWGHVGRDGVVVPLPLTQETLGKLVGAHRLSVTRALKTLTEHHLVERRPDGWLLVKGYEERLERLFEADGAQLAASLRSSV